MGIPIVVKANKHICPMVEGLKPHVGGPVSETSITGVTIDGIPIAVVGDKCTCTGSSASDEIVQGCQGILVDGKPIAILGSMTTHGGIIIEGVPGVTISGPLVPMSGDPQKLEPRIFNLRWMKNNEIIKSDYLEEEVTLKASVVGIEDGDEVEIKIENKEGLLIVDTTAIVQNGEAEVTFKVEDGHFTKKEETDE